MDNRLSPKTRNINVCCEAFCSRAVFICLNDVSRFPACEANVVLNEPPQRFCCKMRLMVILKACASVAKKNKHVRKIPRRENYSLSILKPYWAPLLTRVFSYVSNITFPNLKQGQT